MSCIQTLLNEIVDYAGLFPPAKLPLDQAVRSYAEYRRSGDAWMLGRFICPAGKIDELEGYAETELDPKHGAWRLSALGRSGDDAETFLNGIDADVRAMQHATVISDGRAVIDAIETRLPEAVVATADGKKVVDLVTRTVDRIESGGLTDKPHGLAVFFEVAFVGDWRRSTDVAIEAVAACNETGGARSARGRTGVKIRTGGVKAEMVPSIEKVALFLHRCAACGVPFKATAGLHHPIRHHSTEVDAKMHGFLNVFAAAVLAFANGASEATLCTVLAEESADAFRFGDGFAWRAGRVTVEQIAAARRDFAISFGSCSFTEPVEGLRALGFWSAG